LVLAETQRYRALQAAAAVDLRTLRAARQMAAVAQAETAALQLARLERLTQAAAVAVQAMTTATQERLAQEGTAVAAL
jgi:hypothetical protein